MKCLIPRLFLATFVFFALAAVDAEAGTASITPADFERGQTVTVTYNSTGGPLAGASSVRMHFGFNSWTTVNPVDVVMTAAGANQWTATVDIPVNVSQLDFVFHNGANTYDNNGGGDWHFAVASELGSTVVPAAQGGGVIFRVWAPNATSAHVRGTFNTFNLNNPMVLNAATGVWSAWVPSAVAGHEYKYFLSGTTWRKDPRARAVANSNGNSVIVNTATYNWQGDDFTTPPDRELVIYEMHIGSTDFGNGTPPGRFTDAIARLDYLDDLGINAVELMPVTEFPGDIGGGYNPSDPYALETNYGTPNQFRDFVREAHERGIAVLVDVVYNHWGPGDLDLYNFDSGTTGGIYFYDSPPELAQTPFGSRPEFSSAGVRDFIQDNVRMYVDEYHVDGFRWDFTKGIRGIVDSGFNVTAPIPEGISLLRESNDFLDTSYPDVISIAEDLANDPNIVLPTTNSNGLGFDSQWNVNYHFRVVEGLDDPNDADRDMNALSGQINGNFDRTIYLESHDEVWALNAKDRIATRFDPANPTSYRARKLSALGAGLLFGSEGIPLIFQGEEWGEAARWNEFEGLNWARPTTAPYSGLHALHRDLIHLRRNVTGVTRGLTGDTNQIIQTLQQQRVIAWYRQHTGGAPGDTVVLLANFSASSYSLGFEIGFPQAGTWYEHFNSDSTEYGADFTNVGVGQTVTTVASPLHGFPQRGAITIGPYSVVILSQAREAGPTGILTR